METKEDSDNNKYIQILVHQFSTTPATHSDALALAPKPTCIETKNPLRVSKQICVLLLVFRTPFVQILFFLFFCSVGFSIFDCIEYNSSLASFLRYSVILRDDIDLDNKCVEMARIKRRTNTQYQCLSKYCVQE